MQHIEPNEFEPFFMDVLHYIERGGNPYVIEQMLNALETQIRGWLKTPPIKTEFAEQVMRNVINASLPKEDKYHRYRGRLRYLAGLIRETGFKGSDGVYRIKPHPKQMLIDFNDATLYGYAPAWVKLGDAYFQLAKQAKFPITQSQEYHDAVKAYIKGDKEAKQHLIDNCFALNIKENIELGNFDEAIATIRSIANLCRDNPGLLLATNVELMKKRIPELVALKKILLDTQIYYAKSLMLSTVTIEQKLAMFRALRESLRLSGTENPALDYYYACFLKKHATLKSRDKNHNPQEVKDDQAQAYAIFNRIIADDYPEVYYPLLDFIKAMGINESQDIFIKTYGTNNAGLLQAAAKSGCYLAYSYMGDSKGADNAKLAEPYYLLGAEAGDARCLFAYYQRFLSQAFVTLREAKDYPALIAACQRALKYLNNAQMNPAKIDDSITEEYLQKNIALVDSLITDYARQPECIRDIAFAAIDRPELNELKFLIYQLGLIGYTQYERRLEILYQIKSCATELITQPGIKSDPEVFKKLETINNRIDFVIEYHEKQFYLSQLNVLSSATRKQRLQAFVDFIKQSGHLDDKYYNEYLDPLHRKPELLLQWVGSGTTKNYFSWLLSFDSFAPSHVERVKYNRPREATRFLTKADNGKLVYDNGNAPIADGKYLYVLDKQNKLYIASETLESHTLLHFHHSSFLSGKPVLCGGEVIMRDGKIAAINNYSGHYMPNVFRLYFAFIQLKQRGVLADDVMIGLVGVQIPPDVEINLNKLTLNQLRQLAILSTFKSPRAQQYAPQIAMPANPPQQNDAIDPNLKKIEQRILNYLSAKERGLEMIAMLVNKKWQFSFFAPKQQVVLSGRVLVVPPEMVKQCDMLREAELTDNWMRVSKTS